MYRTVSYRTGPGPVFLGHEEPGMVLKNLLSLFYFLNQKELGVQDAGSGS